MLKKVPDKTAAAIISEKLLKTKEQAAKATTNKIVGLVNR